MRDLDILLIEDDERVQFVMNAALEHLGHHVTIVGTAADAIRSLSVAHCHQIVLLDLNLDLDRGEDIFLALIANAITYPPVIIVSALPIGEIQKAARMIHAAGFVQKPAQIEDLSAAMEAAVS